MSQVRILPRAPECPVEIPTVASAYTDVAHAPGPSTGAPAPPGGHRDDDDEPSTTDAPDTEPVIGRRRVSRPTSRRATIEDVAARADVSVATVSRALRGLPNVAVATRERVAEVAASLNYRPDPAASRLAARKTKTITVGVPSLSGWYFSTVVAGAEAVCNEAGYEFQVIAVGSLDARDRLLDDEHQIERRTDGLILVDVAPSEAQAAALVSRGVVLATVGNVLDGHPSVTIDDDEVGRLAAEHLVGLGHRTLGVIDGMSDDPMNFTVPTRRRQGFERALRDHGIELADGAVQAGNFDVDGGRSAMERLLRRSPRPTAVFAMSDEMAFGALMTLGRHDLSAGSDLSIVGVDDHEFSRVVGLTTIRQPVTDHGADAARLLIDAMTTSDVGSDPTIADRRGSRHSAPAVAVRRGIELVVRTSTGLAERGDAPTVVDAPGRSAGSHDRGLDSM